MATDCPMPSDSSWYWKLETPEWEARIRSQAIRMFHSEPEILDVAIEHARRETIAQARAGKIPINTDAFLLTLLKRKLIDFSRQRYGYCRPPPWVKRLGRIWEAVYHLLCVLKIPPEEIGCKLVGRHLSRQHRVVADEQTVTEAIVQESIREILRKETECRKPKAPPVQSLNVHVGNDGQGMVTDAIPEPEQPGGAVEDVLNREAIERVLDVLRAILAGEKSNASAVESVSDRAIADLEKFARCLTISDRERLVLRLVYQEGLSARAVAQALKEHERTVQRVRKQAERKIAAAFDQAEIADPFTLLSAL